MILKLVNASAAAQHQKTGIIARIEIKAVSYILKEDKSL